ncbi:MAG: response regulator transcription factor [Bacteroidales bacterium]|nr:response regulator transcription factor [Bacteroidales bacterium]
MRDDAYKILVIDDESDIIEFLTYNLKKEGYEIFSALNGREGIELARKHNPHLILLDIMMPEMDGIETCEKLRALPKLNKTIIAFLTARGEDYSQIAGFEAGGDDYITKPVKPKVLVSRIRALLKRYGKYTLEPDSQEQAGKIKRGNLVIDREKYIVSVNNRDLVLPKKEFELLLLISSKPGKVFTRDDIFSQVWGDDVIVGDRTIDVHIRKLREKIGDEHISTVKGVGYKFKE